MVIIKDPQDVLINMLCNKVKLIPTKHIQCLGLWNDETQTLNGIVGYDNWTDTAVEMHVASGKDDKHWINKELLYKAFYYPFVTCNRQVIIAKVNSRDKNVLEFDKKLGFKEIGRIPNAYPESEMVILAMQKSECRWLKLTQRHKRAA
jgi:hypothetical protein